MKTLKKRFFSVSGVCISALAWASPIHAHAGHTHAEHPADTLSAAHTAQVSQRAVDSAATANNQPIDAKIMGIEEKTGAMLPLDGRFATADGDSVTLRQCMSGPTVLNFLFFGCHDACNLLLIGMAQALRGVADNPAKAPTVITVSIGEREGPADARKARAIAFESLQKPYPDGKWRFLTGSEENIRKLTAAAGFHFVKKEGDYDHPLAVIILSPGGMVSRYITGTDFLPADLTVSLMEANKGSLQPAIARVLRSCFSVDPTSRRLVFKTLQVSATVILTLASVFALSLVFASRSRRRKGGGE